MSHRPVSSHFIRFALIGAIGTAVHFVVLDYLVRFAQLSSVLSSQVGAIFGALTNYLLNRKFNYGSQASHLETGPRFFTVVLIGFVLNGLLMKAFADYLVLNYLFAQAITTVFVLFWNFSANHFWTFSEDH